MFARHQPLTCVRLLAFLLGLCVVFTCQAVFADDAIGKDSAKASEVSTAQLKEMVSNLGADQYVTREEASMALYEIGRGTAGPKVRQLLAVAATQADREVRDRSRRVLSLLDEHLQKERLALFQTGKQMEDVPGWKQFSSVYGTTRAARGVYGELLKDEWELLEKCFPTGDQEDVVGVRVVANERFSKLMTRQYGYSSISLGSTLAFFFVGSEYPEDMDLQGQLFHLIRTSSLLAQRLRGAKVNEIQSTSGLTRAIVSKWMLTTIEQDARYEPSAIDVTLRGRLFHEAKLVAAHILKNKDSLPVNKKTAMQIIAALRDKTGIPLIEPYLEDETKLRRESKRLQLRDVALTCLMDLNDNDLTLIGVKRSNDLLNPYDYSSLGFDTEQERQKAFDLFKELQAEKKYQEQKKTSKP